MDSSKNERSPKRLRADSNPDRNTLAYWVGTGFTRSVLLPFAPGTEGSLVSWLLGLVAFFWVGPWMLTALMLCSLIAGWWSAIWFVREIGDDPSEFVMDEWAGQLIALHILFIVPPLTDPLLTIGIIVGAFVIFRVFDILKPLGIRHAEKIGGTTGIMIDDIIAGFYTFITLFFVILAVL